MKKFSVRVWFVHTRLGRTTKEIKNLFEVSLARALNRVRGFDDFFEFPFDISKPMPNMASDVLKDLILYMNLNQIEYWLAEGTLLGIVRDGQLIPHDTDLDFYLIDTFFIDKIQNFLERKGFRVGRLLKFRGKVTQITFYDRNKLLIDFLVWQKSEDLRFDWFGPEIRGRRSQDSYFFHPVTFIKWQNVEFRTFNNVIGWLEMVYGENWKTPETKKTDWTKSIGDLK